MVWTATGDSERNEAFQREMQAWRDRKRPRTTRTRYVMPQPIVIRYSNVRTNDMARKRIGVLVNSNGDRLKLNILTYDGTAFNWPNDGRHSVEMTMAEATALRDRLTNALFDMNEDRANWTAVGGNPIAVSDKS